MMNDVKIDDDLTYEHLMDPIIMDSIDVGIVLIDPKKHHIIDINEYGASLIGLSKNDIIGKRCHHFICPALEGKCPVTDLGQTIDRAERVLLTNNHGAIPIHKTVKYINIKGNTFLLESFVDIRELKKRTEDRQRLLHIIEQSPMSIVITDQFANIEYVNTFFTKVTGYTADEVRGKNPKILQSGYHSESYYKDMWATLLSGKIWRGELCNKKKNQEYYWESASILPIMNTNGEITQFVGVKDDISDRKYIELKLVRAKELAEHANRLKTEFVSNMSHEIRTPLHAIMGMIELLLSTQMNEKQLKYIRMLQDSSGSLLTLVNDILDFSKIEANTIVLDYGEFNLKFLLKELVELEQINAQKKHLNIMMNIQPDVPILLIGDSKRLRQIFVNLLNNAVKFTEKGYISIRLFVVNMDKTQCTLGCEVKDTGIGIPIERSGTLFQLFSQVDSSISRKYGGIGLGLVITKKLIELMGGTISVESSEGNGTTFHFTVVLTQSVKI
ncbi:MAG: PAS domain-containing protein [Desulfobacterales bacterium]|nr:PAS domain-containing protein [Desulfobacterales bacterium]